MADCSEWMFSPDMYDALNCRVHADHTGATGSPMAVVRGWAKHLRRSKDPLKSSRLWVSTLAAIFEETEPGRLAFRAPASCIRDAVSHCASTGLWGAVPVSQRFREGVGHATVLFVLPQSRRLIHYNPHGAYWRTSARVLPLLHAEVAALNHSSPPDQRWQLYLPNLPCRGLASVQGALGLCQFYSAFVAWKVAGTRTGIEAVLSEMHRETAPSVEREFRRFAVDVLWALSPRIGPRSKVDVLVTRLDGPQVVVGHVTDSDPRKRAYRVHIDDPSFSGLEESWWHFSRVFPRRLGLRLT